jgi:hypothetical protein
MIWVYVFLFVPIPTAYLLIEVHDWIMRGSDAYEDVR